MAHVVLFHHVLGLTPGIASLAERLRSAGHEVDTPDLFAGRTFATIEDGIAHLREIGFTTPIERATPVVEAAGHPVVVAGVSMGAMSAQALAQTRPGLVAAALLLESCAPMDEFGGGWPAGVPVQVHAMDADPFFVGEGDIAFAREVVAAAEDAELFLYPGDQHLFLDDSLPSHRPEAASAAVDRMLAFLDRVGAGQGAAPRPGAPSAAPGERWRDLDGVPRDADERTMLDALLDWYRDGVLAKVAGLTDEQARQRHVGSETTIVGLVTHLALVEDSWFEHRFAGRAEPEPWRGVDWDADPDWEFVTARDGTLAQACSRYREAVARSRAVQAAAAYDDVAATYDAGRGPFTLRWLMLHMLEETARHLGHLDILRELTDGVTGE